MYTGRTTTREELIESMFADGAGGGGGGGGFQAGVMNELLSGKTFINFSPDNIKAKHGPIMTTAWQENVTIDKDGTANVIAKRIATFYIDINRALALQSGGGNLGSTLKEVSTALSAATYIPLTTLGAMYTKPIRSITNPHISKPSIGSLRVMSDAGKTFKTIGTTVGAVGLGLTYTNMIYEGVTEGQIRNSTYIDAGISTFLFTGSTVPNPAMPFFWGAGVIYGGVRLMWGDQIDNYFNR